MLVSTCLNMLFSLEAQYLEDIMCERVNNRLQFSSWKKGVKIIIYYGHVFELINSAIVGFAKPIFS